MSKGIKLITCKQGVKIFLACIVQTMIDLWPKTDIIPDIIPFKQVILLQHIPVKGLSSLLLIVNFDTTFLRT